jgi:hypothetical protein
MIADGAKGDGLNEKLLHRRNTPKFPLDAPIYHGHFRQLIDVLHTGYPQNY